MAKISLKLENENASHNFKADKEREMFLSFNGVVIKSMVVCHRC